jgi:DNA replication protein DnaC
MLTNNTIMKLQEMHLGVMANALKDQLTDAAYVDMCFEDRIGFLIDAEWSTRRSNRMTRLIKKADYAISDACLENIDYASGRSLDKSQILRLSTCNYILEYHNVVILGATGAGKTYLACALGMAANRNFYTVKYLRLPDLLVELAVARGDGTYRTVMKHYKTVKLLILDEWLLFPLKETEARDLLEIVEARNRKASTIFCSQFDVAGWYLKIGEPTVADAVCDRIVNDSYTIKIEGDSMRKRTGLCE